MVKRNRKAGMDGVQGCWRPQEATLNQHQAESGTAKFLHKVRVVERKLVREGKKAPEALRAVAIRPMVIDDASYVLDSWANSFRRSPTTGPIDREVFNIEQRARIDRLVTRTASRVFVACDAEFTSQIRGWICFEAPHNTNPTPIVHYVCVQPSYQLNGVGTALVGIARQTHTDESAPMWSTHETQPMRYIREKWGLLYNPYLLEVADRNAAQVKVGFAKGLMPDVL